MLNEKINLSENPTKRLIFDENVETDDEITSVTRKKMFSRLQKLNLDKNETFTRKKLFVEMELFQTGGKRDLIACTLPYEDEQKCLFLRRKSTLHTEIMISVFRIKKESVFQIMKNLISTKKRSRFRTKM